PQMLASLPDGWASPLYYYGDLDLRGIEIAADGHERAQDLGLGPLTCASPLYRLLLEVGTAIKPKSRPRTAVTKEVLNWFPAELQEPIADLVATGMRIPQEATGLRQFTQLSTEQFDPLGTTRTVSEHDPVAGNGKSASQ
ncbi:hypothetical protein, partial [Actinoplanes philippinensis]|uniref:hypothetical protein n=1 Tax=Actinoplanes philippinensis TaxID=35752 RepID=UPI003407C8E6